MKISCCFALLAMCVAAPPAESAQKRQGPKKVAKAETAKPIVDMQAVQTQVMLDRAGFSPGQIDGAIGASTNRALDAFTKNGGKADALPADALVTYCITDQDAAGPFTASIPEDMVEKSKLQALGYTSLLEALAERFHASPALLRRLNPAAKFAAGEEIQVPNVADAAPSENNSASTIVTVRKSTSDLVVADATGKVLMYAPVTTGSEHDPLPIGEWKVTGVQRDPKFHYNPDLFWDADAAHSKATIPPGPNSPVGVVWVDITKPHYGLHGTPEPGTIGRSESHGCVRLTNWDATRLASLVRPGTKVVFSE